MPKTKTKKVKLFGFHLTMTSALLLFISSSILLLTGLYGIYTVITVAHSITTAIVIYLAVFLLIILVVLYIWIQTLRFRHKNVRKK